MEKLHPVGAGSQLEYYDAILDTIKRYIRDGYPFNLTTEIGEHGTAITFHFDRAVLADYMAHLDGTSDGAKPGASSRP